MITEISGILWFVFHSEWGQTAAVNRWFSANLVFTGAVPIQSSVRQGCKHGVQGTEDFYITVGDNFMYSFVQLSDFPWAGIFWFLRKSKRWSLKDQAFCDLFVILNEAKLLQQIIGFRQHFSHRCCAQSVEHVTRSETWHPRCWDCWSHFWWQFFTFAHTIKCFALILNFSLSNCWWIKKIRNQLKIFKRWALKDHSIYYWFDVVKESGKLR